MNIDLILWGFKQTFNFSLPHEAKQTKDVTFIRICLLPHFEKLLLNIRVLKHSLNRVGKEGITLSNLNLGHPGGGGGCC